MPAVAGGDQHRVNILLLGQQVAHIAVEGAVLVVISAVDHLFHCFAAASADVADRQKLNIGFAQYPTNIARPASADAYGAHEDPLAGCDGSATAQGRSGNDQGNSRRAACRNGALEEPTSRDRSAVVVAHAKSPGLPPSITAICPAGCA
jgi:hypothetical protein